MGSIRADYTIIPHRATEMVNCTIGISKELSYSFKAVDELKSTWTGIRYDTVTAIFNQMIPTFTELIDLLGNKIPQTLGTIAKNYAKFDGGVAANVTDCAAASIEEISKCGTTIIDIDQAIAERTLAMVQKNFDHAKTSINDTYVKLFSSIDWQGEAHDSFKAEFDSLTAKAIQLMDNAAETFKKEMTSTIEEVNLIENANDVGVN